MPRIPRCVPLSVASLALHMVATVARRRRVLSCWLNCGLQSCRDASNGCEYTVATALTKDEWSSSKFSVRGVSREKGSGLLTQCGPALFFFSLPRLRQTTEITP